MKQQEDKTTTRSANDSPRRRVAASPRLDSASTRPAAASSPKGRFATSVAWTVGARLVMLAGNLSISIVVARWLGAQGLGTLAVLNVAVAVALQLGSFGLPSAMTYFIAQDRRRLAPAWTNALCFALVTGTTLALALIMLARVRPEIFGNIPLTLITIVAVSIPFQLATLLGLNALLGAERLIQFNLLESLAQVIVALGTIVLLVLMGRELQVLVSFNTAASVVVCALVAFTIHRVVAGQKERGRFRPDAELFKSSVRYGLKFHVSVVSMLLIVRADLLLVNHFRGATEAGVYAVAAQVASLIMLLPAVVATLVFPRIVSSADSSGEFTMRVTRHTTFIMLLLCLAAAPAGFALPFVYGVAFRDAPIQLLILLPGIFLMALQAVLVQYFNSLGVPRLIPAFWVMTLIVNLALNLSLIPLYGARGAAISSTISYTMIFFLVSIYFFRRTGNHFAHAFVLRGEELRELLRMGRGARVRARQEA